MGKALSIREVLFVLLLLLLLFIGFTYVGMCHVRGMHDRQDSRKFAEDTILAIADNWDGNELARRASPELREWLTPQHLRDIEMRQLGKLKHYNGVTFAIDPDCVRNSFSITSYSYQAVVDFDAGSV